MKIKVIGSGSIWSISNSACYLVNDIFLVDMPNGCMKNMLKLNINPKSVNNILFTHFHGDHYLDVPFYLLGKLKSDVKDIRIMCSKDGARKIKKVTKLAFPNTYKTICKELRVCFNNGFNFNINDYSIEKILVDHGRMKPAYGYIISKGNKSVGFTGDSKLVNSIKYIASKCDVLFCDVSFIKGTSKHMGINDIVNLCSEYPECKFISTHMNDDVREELSKMSICNLVVGYDGMEVSI